MNSMEISYLVEEFIDKISDGKIEIYNEASVQYELAIFLRARLKNYKIQLERNVTYFDLSKSGLEKKEIDVVIFKKKKRDRLAIEIKFPTNGQYPEQMFSFAKDIKFLEQLKDKGFKNNLFIAFANDKNFWNEKGDEGTIYNLFRKEKRLYDRTRKPTGKKDEVISLKGNYQISWRNVDDETRCFIIKI